MDVRPIELSTREAFETFDRAATGKAKGHAPFLQKTNNARDSLRFLVGQREEPVLELLGSLYFGHRPIMLLIAYAVKCIVATFSRSRPFRYS